MPPSSRVNCKGQTKPSGDLCKKCSAIEDESEQVKEADQKMHAVAAHIDAKAAAESDSDVDWDLNDTEGAEALKAANRMQTDDDD